MVQKMSAAMTVLVSLLLLALGSIFLMFLVPVVYEAFGAQGGEMVQLAAGHVPTAEDLREQEQEARQVQKEIVNMTGYW
jgi:xanthine dehydrogenase iron-sulfur cluster and FAD-binding subunit A